MKLLTKFIDWLTWRDIKCYRMEPGSQLDRYEAQVTDRILESQWEAMNAPLTRKLFKKRKERK